MDTNNYEVEFTEECVQEIKKIYNYIRDNLYAENSAKRIMNMVEEYTNNLIYSPKCMLKFLNIKERMKFIEE